ncbi:MAG: PLP-dependent aminotransferase family protein [Clostridia bacterium]|nr:PLP-dependent aminotransferase family protein [Clostridia bacterium]
MLYIQLDKNRRRSYTDQIYRQMREKILHGELAGGDRLPSSRALAQELNVARNTVSLAYEQLSSDGFAQSVSGSGVFIKHGVQSARYPEEISDFYITSLAADELPLNVINFDSGIPALDLFPRGKWNRVLARAFNEAPVSALGYDYPEGRPELRRTLAAYLYKSRGIKCDPAQLIITSGTKQGLTLIAKCLLSRDSEVWLEDPSNDNVRRIFAYHTAHLTPVAVDGEGIRTDSLPAGSTPDLIFVTPSHQFPMGGILSIQRRQKLAEFARKTGCYILEDDYDSEFRYNGEVANSLFELNRENVIYAGTFSKVLYPSLRLGYLVLPWPLVGQCRQWKRLSDHHSNSVCQLALMHFIESGDLERHIMRMKKVYRRRRECLLSLLREHFGSGVKVLGDPAGMHIVAEFEGAVFSDETVRHIRDMGVSIVPVEKHAVNKGAHENQIIMGFANLTPEEMELGIIKIKTALGIVPNTASALV